MAHCEFTGFGGLKIVADTYGQEDHPCVLLLPSATQSRKVWDDAARALAKAGRFVVSVDLRGHGDSGYASDGRYDIDSFVADLIAVLAQLSSRPVIVGSNIGGWIALTALGEARAPLATGLVLTNPPPRIGNRTVKELTEVVRRQAADIPEETKVDPALPDGGFDFKALEHRLTRAAAGLKIPTLIVRGADSELSTPEMMLALTDSIPAAESAEISGGGHYVAFDKADEFNALLLEFLERRIPREPPEFVSGSDARTLRDAMGCFATGITVITTSDVDGKPIGLTVNSFSSVSLDPPLVLACLAKNAGSLAAFKSAEAFAINVLHIGQQPLSNLFARKDEDRFKDTPWETWEHQVPIIENSLASFECLKRNTIEQGDHVIFVGEVVKARFEQRRDPLLYYCGKYRRLHLN